MCVKCLHEIKEENTRKSNAKNLYCWQCKQRNLRGKVRSLFQLISEREGLCKRQYLRWLLTDGRSLKGMGLVGCQMFRDNCINKGKVQVSDMKK